MLKRNRFVNQPHSLIVNLHKTDNLTIKTQNLKHFKICDQSSLNFNNFSLKISFQYL